MTYMSLDDKYIPPTKKSKCKNVNFSKQDKEACAKAELWKLLAESLKPKTSNNSNTQYLEV